MYFRFRRTGFLQLTSSSEHLNQVFWDSLANILEMGTENINASKKFEYLMHGYPAWNTCSVLYYRRGNDKKSV